MGLVLRFGFSLLGGAAMALHRAKSFTRRCHAADLQVQEGCWAKWKMEWDEILVDPCDRDPTAVMHLLFVRHGQYFTKTKEQELTPLGRDQAKAAGRYLGALCKRLNVPIDRSYSSSMNRAKETQRIALQNLPNDIPKPDTHEERGFNECCPQMPDPAIPGYFPSERSILKGKTVLDRAFKENFLRASDGEELEVYFVHANVIRYFMLKLLQMPLNCYLRFNLKHCSFTHIMIDNEGYCTCQAYGEAGFMPPNMQSFNNK